jgi:hypothetical protein
MTPTPLRCAWIGLLLAGVAPAAAVAQEQVIAPSDYMDFDRPESWAMKYFAATSLPTGIETPQPTRFGSIRLGLELGWVPHLDKEQRMVGFMGTKEEDLNQIPVFGRLIATVGLPRQLSLTVGWVPPLRIHSVRADMVYVALGAPILRAGGFMLAVRGYGQIGYVTGAFTCSRANAAAGSDPVKNPFDCKEASSDQSWLGYLGGEATTSVRFRHAHGLEPYLSLAGSWLDLEFNVVARYGSVIDRTRLFSHGFVFSLAAGLRLPIIRGLEASAEVFYAPLAIERGDEPSRIDGLFNVRGAVIYRFF